MRYKITYYVYINTHIYIHISITTTLDVLIFICPSLIFKIDTAIANVTQIVNSMISNSDLHSKGPFFKQIQLLYIESYIYLFLNIIQYIF